MDDIAKQSFTQNARDRWKYDVTSKGGRNFSIEYVIQPYGFIKEVLKEGDTLIWDRDIKIGENVSKTWHQYIQG